MSTDTKAELIEKRIDRGTTESLSFTADGGGASFRTMIEVMEFAKLMAVSDIALPKFLRGNVGACLAVCVQAVEWRMSPFAVANKAYSVNDRLAYESQLIHAVIENRAPLVGRLRCEYAGQGDARTCKIIGRVVGEEAPLEYTSPPIGQITPKNSPLWKTKPDLQLFYNASRDWARMYFPDVLMGVYSTDELEQARTIVDAAPIPRSLKDLTDRATAAIEAAKQQQQDQEATA